MTDVGIIMNVDPAEVAKIIHDDIERDTSNGYDRFNSPPPPIPIRPVKVKSLKEKIDNYKRRKKEMKATSVQNIKNVKDVCFSIDNHPMEMESKLTIVATTNDDIFAFEFEGPDLLQSCKRAGLFTGWEKEAADCLRLRDEAQKEAYKLKKENEKYEEKIKKLEHDDMLDKDAADYLSKEYDILLERFAKLQVENENLKEEYEDLHHKYGLERAANEAHHRFFHQYAGKGTEIEFNCAIDDTKEVSYVIVDKDRYQTFKDNSNRCTMINGRSYTISEMVDRIVELEELKTPIIENFADESERRFNEKLHDFEVNNKKYDEKIMGEILNKVKRNSGRYPWGEEKSDEPSTRSDILDQAKKCVCGQREQDYGSPESNFQLIADLWNGYLGTKYRYVDDDKPINIAPLRALDVSMMMALLKIARIKNGGGSGDSFVDLAGYAACGGEIWAGNKKSKDQT